MKNIWSVEHILFVKDLIFKLNRKVEKGERNDEMTRTSKPKAFLKMLLDLFLCVVYWIFAILDTVVTNGFDQFTNKPSALLSRR